MSDTKSYPEWVTCESERRIYDDFRAFVWLIWRHLKLPPPTKRQLAIALYLQHGPRRRMIQAWRGAAKSFLTCAYALWRLYRNPNERVKIVSANENKALENATFIRRLIDEVEQLHFLRPRQGQRDATMAFDVGPADAAPTPSVSCVGITGQLTGGRATILVSDDVEVPKNSYTEAMRERLAELVKEYDALVVPEGFDIIVLGTPQTEQSIYKIMRQRGYDCRIWPVRFPQATELQRYEGALAPDILAELQADPSLGGRSVEPGRFSDLDLAEREASYGKSGFALQFMLDTSLSDADRYPLKTADLLCMDIDMDVAPAKVVWSSDPRLAWTDIGNLGFTGDRLYRPMHCSETMQRYQARLMVVDPSGRGGDETAYVVLYMLNGMLFLKEWGGFRSGYDEATLDGLTTVAQRHQVNHLLVESNFGDGMFVKLLEPYLVRRWPVTTEEVRATGQKERRIVDDLEPVLNQHRLVIDAAMVRKDVAQGEADPKYSLMYQLTHLTKERGALRHDDRIDALAHGVRYFREQLARDTERAEAQHLDKLREQALREFVRHAKGGKQTKSKFTRIKALS